jgi:predicted permease
MDVDRLVTVSIDLAAAGVRQREANATYSSLLDRVQRTPAVQSAAISMGAPFTNGAQAGQISVDGPNADLKNISDGPYFRTVSPDYFSTIGDRLIAGRSFAGTDVKGTENVAIVSATFARLAWPGQAAIGRCLFIEDPAKTCRRVVGVVADAKSFVLTEPAPAFYYLPFAQVDNNDIDVLLVRTRGDPSKTIGALRHEIRAAGNLPYATVEPMIDRVAPYLRSWRLGADAFGTLGLLALLIAAVGIFAVLQYTVQQRSKDIGLRLALGAQTGDVIRMILRQSLKAVSVGLALGVLGSLALGHSIRSLLYGVASDDPRVLTVTAVVLLATALAASYLPARRASRISPLAALQSE